MFKKIAGSVLAFILIFGAGVLVAKLTVDVAPTGDAVTSSDTYSE